MTPASTPTARELFDGPVRSLPARERLRLVAFILEDASDPRNLPGYSEEWTDEDLRDIRAATMNYAAAKYPDDDEIA
jgi:hypothetical protein